jgi:phage gp16-like protein
MTLSKPQITILHVAKSKLALDDDTYRQVLVRVAGVTSSKDLDNDGFQAVMGYFDYAGFRPTGRAAPRYGNRPGMASFAQLELIREVWRELHHEAEVNEEALAGWLLKYHKVHSLRFLTAEAARKVITALKAWKSRVA